MCGRSSMRERAFQSDAVCDGRRRQHVSLASSSVNDNPPLLSVVVPLRNEEEVLPSLAERLAATLERLGNEWEVILVDDGSSDGTYGLAVELHEWDPRFKVIGLSRGFGHQVALSAGLDRARGEAVVTMDGDLQHPPEVIPELVSRWESGDEVVYGVMEERKGENRFKDGPRGSSIDCLDDWPTSTYRPARVTSGWSTGARSMRSVRCESRTAISGECSAGWASASPASRTPHRRGRQAAASTPACECFASRQTRSSASRTGRFASASTSASSCRSCRSSSDSRP